MENTPSTQPPFRPEDELQFIRKIIADSRMAFVEDGKPYIVWGLIVAIGMGVTYISAITQHDLYSGYVWLGLVLFGWGTIIKYVMDKKKQPARARSFIDRIQGSIWGACGGSIGLVIVLLMFNYQFDPTLGSINPIFTCFFSCILLGIAYFLSGIANDLDWLRNIGFAWWGGGVLMYMWPSIHTLGIYAAMLLLFQVIPGIILQRRYKKLMAIPAGA